jgi:vacuolar iron transporter family protein
MSSEPQTEPTVTASAQGPQIASKLNWLRAGVMGANDGIVSTAAMVVGVAGAAVSHQVLLVSGAASVVAGAISMAVGEYVSVSSQKDSERAQIEHERKQLAADPRDELVQLTGLIEAQGLDATLARQVAEHLTQNDALAAHAHLELGIDPNALPAPWTAALASVLAFVLGGAIPFLAVVLAPPALFVPVTSCAVIVALACTGAISAGLGRAPVLRAMLRTTLGGVLAMAVTYGVGALIAASS